MKQHDIKVFNGSAFPENDPLWIANLEQFEQLRCQASVSGNISASQAIIEPYISTKKKEV